MKILMRDLEYACNRLNLIAGTPKTPYSKVDGKNVANVGNYHLDSAYGGWKLVQMGNESGGIRNITDGYVSKSELYHLIHSYIRGFEDCQNNQKG
jgi:hypothetical protein